MRAAEIRGFYAVLDREDETLARVLAAHACVLQVRLKPRGQRVGADYIGFGPVFATATKENPDRVQGLEGLRAAVAIASVPVVAIGGISAPHARAVYDTGAAAICAISAVNAASEVAAAARAIGCE